LLTLGAWRYPLRRAAPRICADDKLRDAFFTGAHQANEDAII